MKNARDYKSKLEKHLQFGGYDYLTPEEAAELRQDINAEKRRGAVFYDGIFYKTAEVFSVTTLKHINAFRAMLKLEAVNKYDWINTETSRTIYDFNGKAIQI